MHINRNPRNHPPPAIRSANPQDKEGPPLTTTVTTTY